MTLSSADPLRNPSISMADREPMSFAPANLHYQMSDEIRHKIEIPVWLGDNENDPALQVSTALEFCSIFNSTLNLNTRTSYHA